MVRKILFVGNHAGFFVSHRLPIACAASAAGYDVHVATPRSKHVPRLVASGLAWHELRLSRSGMNPFAELATLHRIYRLYRRLRPDLVDHVSSKPVLYGTVAARLARVPAVVNQISGLGHVFAAGASAGVRALVSAGYRVALRHPNMRIFVESRDHQRLFTTQQQWVRDSECRIGPVGGVDVDAYRPHPPRVGEVTVLLASRMLYTKGVVEFVNASRMVRALGLAVRFILVGEPDPDNRGSIPLAVLRRWHEQGLIEYRGRSENMPAVFAEADIVCLPTYYGEGVPKVLMEAGACALPVVTTDWPGCRDIVEDGVNGMLVPIRDAAALARAIARLAADRVLREAMGSRGRERVLAHYATDDAVAQTLEVYQELLA
jgi:glycosyltransferase involved in cell wall biosynthesis